MIPQSTIINYVCRFLASEIEEIEKILEKDTISEPSKKLLSRVLKGYERDLKVLEVELWT